MALGLFKLNAYSYSLWCRDYIYYIDRLYNNSYLNLDLY